MKRLLTALVLVALLVAACSGEEKPPAKKPAAERGGCQRVAEPPAKEDGGQKKPGARLDASKTYAVTLATSCGEMTIELDVKTSPRTSASFVSLARAGFFDGTQFHRIVPGFVIQGGDPTASGTGGPGYSTRDVPPAGTSYRKGDVAMAKTAEEPAGTAGSQFYIVTGEAPLPPEYAVLGKVTEGLDVAERIGKLGDPASGEAGTPIQPVVIEKATVAVK